jgi:NAD(P)H-flavin reductase
MVTTIEATKPNSHHVAGRSVYVPKAAEVLSIEQVTSQEKLLRMAFVDGTPLGHVPGQFAQVSIFGFGECPISICSSPTRGPGFQMCVRNVGEVTNRIHALEKGDQIGIRGPLGHGFDVCEMWGYDMLIIAGGLGLAPARSLIQYVLDERSRFGKFHLLYGARNPNELLFRDDLILWREDPNVQLEATVDRGDPQWRGRTGVVTTLFKCVRDLDPQRTMVAIIGPPVMFKFVVLEVLARGIPQKNIYCSLERRMKCGIGKCGHCQANQVYACLEGPVFKYGQLKALREAIE